MLCSIAPSLKTLTTHVGLTGQAELSSSPPASICLDMLENLEGGWEGGIDILFDGTQAERKVICFIYPSSRKDIK